MPYKTKTSKWYLADVVLEIAVEDSVDHVIHINSVLVNANSPVDAFHKAWQLGLGEAQEPYANPEGKIVHTKFLGLKDLALIHEELKHGAELFFTEYVGLTPQEASKLITAKERLSVFAPALHSPTPDYSSGAIAKDYGDFIKSQHTDEQKDSE